MPEPHPSIACCPLPRWPSQHQRRAAQAVMTLAGRVTRMTWTWIPTSMSCRQKWRRPRRRRRAAMRQRRQRQQRKQKQGMRRAGRRRWQQQTVQQNRLQQQQAQTVRRIRFVSALAPLFEKQTPPPTLQLPVSVRVSSPTHVSFRTSKSRAHGISIQATTSTRDQGRGKRGEQRAGREKQVAVLQVYRAELAVNSQAQRASARGQWWYNKWGSRAHGPRRPRLRCF